MRCSSRAGRVEGNRNPTLYLENPRLHRQSAWYSQINQRNTAGRARHGGNRPAFAQVIRCAALHLLPGVDPLQVSEYNLIVGRMIRKPMGRMEETEKMEVNATVLLIETEPVPLEKDADGVVRVDGTRVTLDTIVAAFEEGATAEEIVYQYPSLGLAAVYSIVGYYLQHRQDVEAYLLWRRQKREQVREQNQARFDPRGIRDRLLARRAAKGSE